MNFIWILLVHSKIKSIWALKTFQFNSSFHFRRSFLTKKSFNSFIILPTPPSRNIITKYQQMISLISHQNETKLLFSKPNQQCFILFYFIIWIHLFVNQYAFLFYFVLHVQNKNCWSVKIEIKWISNSWCNLKCVWFALCNMFCDFG